MTKFVLEAPAGAIAITAGCKDGKCETVEFVNTPSFVGKLDVEVEVGGKPKPLPATHLLGVWGSKQLSSVRSGGVRVVAYCSRFLLTCALLPMTSSRPKGAHSREGDG